MPADYLELIKTWPLGEMIDAFSNSRPAPPAKVASMTTKWKGGAFDPAEFLLIGYEISPNHIRLEDGYNSSTAAGFAGVLPTK